MFYTGSVFVDWQGGWFVGALKLRHLKMIELDEFGKQFAEIRLLKS